MKDSIDAAAFCFGGMLIIIVLGVLAGIVRSIL